MKPPVSMGGLSLAESVSHTVRADNERKRSEAATAELAQKAQLKVKMAPQKLKPKPNPKPKPMEKVASLLESIEAMRAPKGSTLENMAAVADARNTTLADAGVDRSALGKDLTALDKYRTNIMKGSVVKNTLDSAVFGAATGMGTKRLINTILGNIPAAKQIGIGVGVTAGAGKLLYNYVNRNIAESRFNEKMDNVENAIASSTGVSVDDVRKVGTMFNQYYPEPLNDRKLVKVASSSSAPSSSPERLMGVDLDNVTPRVRMTLQALHKAKEVGSKAAHYTRGKVKDAYSNHQKRVKDFYNTPIHDLMVKKADLADQAAKIKQLRDQHAKIEPKVEAADAKYVSALNNHDYDEDHPAVDKAYKKYRDLSVKYLENRRDHSNAMDDFVHTASGGTIKNTYDYASQKRRSEGLGHHVGTRKMGPVEYVGKGTLASGMIGGLISGTHRLIQHKSIKHGKAGFAIGGVTSGIIGGSLSAAGYSNYSKQHSEANNSHKVHTAMRMHGLMVKNASTLADQAARLKGYPEKIDAADMAVFDAIMADEDGEVDYGPDHPLVAAEIALKKAQRDDSVAFIGNASKNQFSRYYEVDEALVNPEISRWSKAPSKPSGRAAGALAGGVVGAILPGAAIGALEYATGGAGAKSKALAALVSTGLVMGPIGAILGYQSSGRDQKQYNKYIGASAVRKAMDDHGLRPVHLR